MLNLVNKINFIWVSTFTLLIFSGNLRADDDYKPAYLPEMETVRAKGDIKIDGKLDDPGWKDLPVAGNFAEHRPGDQTCPPVDTKAMITYDDKNLYVAFICFDDPAMIRANYTDRDEMWQDDNVILLLDTYGNNAWAYELGVNPFGIQGDIIWSQNGGEDMSPELIWESAGKITDSGYQVEMMIPFSSLRFPNKEEQVWRVDFWRNHPRDSRRQFSWAAYDRDIECWPCQWGKVTGIRDISPGKGIELLPTLIGYQSSYLNDPDNGDYDWVNDDVDGEFSLGGKFTPTSNLAVEVTYNPDFSQIEADEAQIEANNSFALFYPEKRPFFQEGSDLFKTDINAIYTRSINNPIGAAKIVARDDKTSIYLLSAYDEDSPLLYPQIYTTVGGLAGESFSNVARFRHTIGEQNYIGALLTDRRFDGGGYSTTYGVDAAFYFLDNYNFEVQGLLSSTEEINDSSIELYFYNDVAGKDYYGEDSASVALDGQTFRGHALIADLERHSRNWWLEIEYKEFSPTFRVDNGFLFQNGYRLSEINSGYTFNKDTKIFDNFGIKGGVGTKWLYNGGKRIDEWIWYELSTQMKAQTYVEFGGMHSKENYIGIEFDNIYDFSIYINSRFSRFAEVYANANYGNRIARRESPPIMGINSSMSIGGVLKPTNRIKIRPAYIYFKLADEKSNEILDEGFITRARIDYQATNRLSLRLIVEYDNFSDGWAIDPLITYRMSSYSVFYLGSSHQAYNFQDVGLKESNRQIFMKLQYLFQM